MGCVHPYLIDGYFLFFTFYLFVVFQFGVWDLLTMVLLCTRSVIVASRLSLAAVPPIMCNEVRRYVGIWFDCVFSGIVGVSSYDVLCS